MLAIGAYADSWRRANEVIESEACVGTLYRGAQSSDDRERVACAWALGIVGHRASASAARKLLFQPEIVRALARNVSSEEVEFSSCTPLNDDAAIFRHCQSDVSMSVGIDSDGAALLLIAGEHSSSLKLKVQVPNTMDAPTSHSHCSIWSKLVVRFMAELVPDMPTENIDTSSSALVAVGYYGRQGLHRVFVHMSTFPWDIGLKVPKVCRRHLKRRKQQKKLRKVSSSIFLHGDKFPCRH